MSGPTTYEGKIPPHWYETSENKGHKPKAEERNEQDKDEVSKDQDAAAEEWNEQDKEEVSKDQDAAAEERLKGKVALIIGGPSGIGEATVRLFLRHGANVIIAADGEEGKTFADSLESYAADYQYHVTHKQCDVTKEDEVEDAVKFAKENYGKLDIMFNNAGILDSGNDEMEAFERVININVKGAMYGLKHAALVMEKGCIISTAGIAKNTQGITHDAYIASKHAIIGLSKNRAVDLGQREIRVNCVSPDGIGTEDNEGRVNVDSIRNNGAYLSVDDIAEAVLFLASDEAKYISGHNLVVVGGFTVENYKWGLHCLQ